MNTATKDAYLEKMSAQLHVWSARVDLLKANVAKGAADARVDFHKGLENWQAKESVLKQKMEELRTAGADTFEIVKSGAQTVWNEATTLLDSLEAKKNALKEELKK